MIVTVFNHLSVFHELAKQQKCLSAQNLVCSFVSPHFKCLAALHWTWWTCKKPLETVDSLPRLWKVWQLWYILHCCQRFDAPLPVKAANFCQLISHTLTASLMQINKGLASAGFSWRTVSECLSLSLVLSWTCLLCLVWSQDCRWCRWRLTSPDSRWRRSSVWRITGVSVWPGALQEPRRAKRHMCASPVSSALLF